MGAAVAAVLVLFAVLLGPWGHPNAEDEVQAVEAPAREHVGVVEPTAELASVVDPTPETERGEVEAEGHQPDAEPVEATVAPQVAVSNEDSQTPKLIGRVLHASGGPAPFAIVQLGELKAKADGDGRFELALKTNGPFNRWDSNSALVATLPGFAPAIRPRFGRGLRDFLKNDRTVELVLPGVAGAIAGFVIDADGSPSEGWRIKLLDGTVVSENDFFPLYAEDAAAQPEADARKGYNVTDEDGAFRLGGLVPDRTYRLRAWNPRTLQIIESEPIHTGTTGVILQVRNDPPRTLVDGMVVSMDGEPLADVRCRLTMNEHTTGRSTWATTAQEVRTGPDGRFAFENVAHSKVYIRFNGHGSTARVHLTPGDEYRDIRVEIIRKGPFRFESTEGADGPTHIAVVSAEGKALMMRVEFGSGTIGTSKLEVIGGAAGALVSELAYQLVLYRGEDEIGRMGLTVYPDAGEPTFVRR